MLVIDGDCPGERRIGDMFGDRGVISCEGIIVAIDVVSVVVVLTDVIKLITGH